MSKQMCEPNGVEGNMAIKITSDLVYLSDNTKSGTVEAREFNLLVAEVKFSNQVGTDLSMMTYTRKVCQEGLVPPTNEWIKLGNASIKFHVSNIRTIAFVLSIVMDF